MTGWRGAVGAGVLAACGPSPVDDGGRRDRTLLEITLPATHNAMSNADDGWALPNQQHPIARQLDDGVRGMLIDTYAWQGEPYLCHGYCELGATPLAAALDDLRAFLEREPEEIVVLIIQDALSIAETQLAFDAAGLLGRALAPPATGEPWPTIGEMIDADRRLVVTRESGGPGPAWFPPFYDVGFDTPYEFRSVDAFSCDVLRGSGDHDLFLVNHWVEDPFPSEANAAAANAADVLRARIDACEAERGHRVNLLAVDGYAVGDLLQVVAERNARD
ncbi:MAG TPA: hypothetical protein PKA64_16125 [Myxococcota bacterium]|nr:hypothetical protein [Myxococcota bacterium]